MKDYHDRKSNVQASTLKAGDNALIKKTGMGRLTTFDKDPVKIVKTKGSMITAQQGNHQVTRNSSYFKKTNFKPLLQSDPDGQDTVSDTCVRLCICLCVCLLGFNIHLNISFIYKDIFIKFAGNIYGCKNLSLQNFALILKNKMAAIANCLKIIMLF